MSRGPLMPALLLSSLGCCETPAACASCQSDQCPSRFEASVQLPAQVAMLSERELATDMGKGSVHVYGASH